MAIDVFEATRSPDVGAKHLALVATFDFEALLKETGDKVAALQWTPFGDQHSTYFLQKS